MDWRIKQGDILDLTADAIIVSANVQLNLSGGVGGAILVRYGDEMQKELHRYLAEKGLSYVERGTVVKTASCGTPFKTVVHAVAIDALYVTTHDVLVETIRKSLALCAESGAADGPRNGLWSIPLLRICRRDPRTAQRRIPARRKGDHRHPQQIRRRRIPRRIAGITVVVGCSKVVI